MQIFDPRTRKSFLAKVQELAISLQGCHSPLAITLPRGQLSPDFAVPKKSDCRCVRRTSATRDFSGFKSPSPLQNLVIASFWQTRRGWETLDYCPL